MGENQETPFYWALDTKLLHMLTEPGVLPTNGGQTEGIFRFEPERPTIDDWSVVGGYVLADGTIKLTWLGLVPSHGIIVDGVLSPRRAGQMPHAGVNPEAVQMASPARIRGSLVTWHRRRATQLRAELEAGNLDHYFLNHWKRTLPVWERLAGVVGDSPIVRRHSRYTEDEWAEWAEEYLSQVSKRHRGALVELANTWNIGHEAARSKQKLMVKEGWIQTAGPSRYRPGPTLIDYRRRKGTHT